MTGAADYVGRFSLFSTITRRRDTRGSRPTVDRHLRLGQQRSFSQLSGREGYAVGATDGEPRST